MCMYMCPHNLLEYMLVVLYYNWTWRRDHAVETPLFTSKHIERVWSVSKEIYKIPRIYVNVATMSKLVEKYVCLYQ